MLSNIYRTVCSRAVAEESFKDEKVRNGPTRHLRTNDLTKSHKRKYDPASPSRHKGLIIFKMCALMYHISHVYASNSERSDPLEYSKPCSISSSAIEEDYPPVVVEISERKMKHDKRTTLDKKYTKCQPPSETDTIYREWFAYWHRRFCELGIQAGKMEPMEVGVWRYNGQHNTIYVRWSGLPKWCNTFYYAWGEKQGHPMTIRVRSNKYNLGRLSRYGDDNQPWKLVSKERIERKTPTWESFHRYDQGFIWEYLYQRNCCCTGHWYFRLASLPFCGFYSCGARHCLHLVREIQKQFGVKQVSLCKGICAHFAPNCQAATGLKCCCACCIEFPEEELEAVPVHLN